jgi:stage II sporulation protein D
LRQLLFDIVKIIPSEVTPEVTMDLTKTSPDQPSDDEVAAIAAALELFVAEEERVQVEVKSSPWLAAGRLEGVGISGARGSGRNKSLWACLLALSLSFCSSAQARSQDSVRSQDILESQDTQNVIPAQSSNQSLSLGAERLGSRSDIRVLLATAAKIDLDFPDGASVYTLADGVFIGRINPQSSWSMSLACGAGGSALALSGRGSGDKFTAASDSYRSAAYTPSATANLTRYCLPLKNGAADVDTVTANASQGYLIVAAKSAAGDIPLFALGGKLYRGALIVRPSGNDKPVISAINALNLEDYLLSVVPSEVPSLWPKEVLKAQAIAARSYAVANLGKHRVDGYDVKATVDDQVYRGVIAEADETNAAVAETNGLVLKHNNQVISAFFHSTSGGSTELAENVWGRSLPYLKSVVDYDDGAPQFNWKKTVSTASLGKSLGDDTLLGVLVVGRHPGDSRRVKDVVVVGKNSARFMSGADLRRALSLPSTQFSLYQSDDQYIFSGRGSGHGLGLSQWGAKALADNGYNALQILSYYYKDVTIESLTPSSSQNM